MIDPKGKLKYLKRRENSIWFKLRPFGCFFSRTVEKMQISEIPTVREKTPPHGLGGFSRAHPQMGVFFRERPLDVAPLDEQKGI